MYCFLSVQNCLKYGKMTAKTPFEKRIKRRIIGPSHKFFIATAMGFERLCLDELNALQFSDEQVAICDGGIEFHGRVHECYIANLHLRTASRILMRINAFKSTNFRQLKRKLGEIDWELYFYRNSIPKIRVTCRNSRLFHKNAIAEMFTESIIARFKEIDQALDNERANNYEQLIFVRAVNDRFSVAIDSSGELLYKRGIKIHGGAAPIRETIAAAALRLAGYDGMEPLVDPMCGSGTFSLEGAFMVNNIPAGWFREFSFMKWPSFKPKRWEYIKKQAWKGFLKIDKPIIFASDQDRKVCMTLEKNVKQYPFAKSIKVCCKNFFDMSSKDIAEKRIHGTGLVVINPPYGLRMEEQNTIKILIPEILSKLVRDFKGWKLAMVMPDKAFLNIVPFKVAVYPFFHGGLNLHLLTGRIL